MLLSSFPAWKYCGVFVQQYLQGNFPHVHSSIQRVQVYPNCSRSQKLKGCSSSLLAWSIEWILLFGEISIYQFRFWNSTLLVSRRRWDNPSSIRQLKRILQHKATLMEEELLHNNTVIPDALPPAPPQHAQPPQRAGDSSNLPPPPSPAVKRRGRPRLALHGRCCPPCLGPWARRGPPRGLPWE